MTRHKRTAHALDHLGFWGKWRVALRYLFRGEMP